MNNKQLIQYLKTSRLLIIALFCAQVLTTTYIVNDIIQHKEKQVDKIICQQELIPLPDLPEITF